MAEPVQAQAATVDGSAEAAPARTIRRTLVAFTYRDFRVQWIGACTSSIGTWMQIVAQNWLIVSLTNSSPFFLGLDAFLQQLPIILFSLIGGVFADRYDRRRTLILPQCVQMGTSGLLALLMFLDGRQIFQMQIWHVLALSFVTGCAQSFGGLTKIATDWSEKMTYRNALALAAMTAAVLAAGAARARPRRRARG